MEKYILHRNGDLIIIDRNECLDQYQFTQNDRKKDRIFQLSYSKYRLLSSAAIELIKSAKNAVIFLTLTFPHDIDQKTANKVLNNFIRNGKTNYNFNDYLGVLELTKIGRPHYHFLIEYPFTDIRKINNAFKVSYKHITGNDGSNTMVRLPKDHKSIVKNSESIVKYVCKYFSKDIKQTYDTRNYFISRGLRERIKPRVLTIEESRYLFEKYKPVFGKKFDHVSIKAYKHEVAELFFNN